MKLETVVIPIAVLLAAFTHPAASQEPASAERATALIQAGDLAEAETVYDRLLAAVPHHIDYLLGRGHVRLWRGDHAGAVADFLDVLAVDPSSVSAHVGMGYSLAWRRQFPEAREHFEAARVADPAATEGARGLALVALWSGSASEAVERFEALLESAPGDADLMVSYGQAHLAAGRRGRAIELFNRALSYDPDHGAARQALDDARTAPAPVEISVWGGYTGFSGGVDGVFGVRFAQLSTAVVPGLRAWVRYDNGLSLDNASLAAGGEDAAMYTAGAVLSWGGRFMTRVEGGWRSLPGGNQRVYLAEQVAVIGAAAALKVGIWLGDRSATPLEWAASGGMSLRVSNAVTLEPSLFVSSDGTSSQRDARGLLVTSLRAGGGTLWTLGVAYGRNAIAPNVSGRIGEAFLGTAIPITMRTRAHFLIRHQRVENGVDLTVLSVGATLGLLGR